MSNIPASGPAWSTLGPKVDNLVKDFISQNKLPGMTVAVTEKGRLILAKGYGLANTQTKEPMQQFMHCPIGSVTKAVVTGPAAFQLMQSKGINPRTTTLYGATGLFGNQFDADIEIGVKRHTPIIDIAIAPDDRVYAWYINGTVSSGTSDNLAQHSAPAPFTLPPGKRPIDIRAIGIASNGRVYVWYDDRTRSIGTSTNLAQHSSVTVCSDEDDSGCVALPGGKSMANIVGIDIAKSNDHVYVWYDDGTVSSGTSMNFAYYFEPKPFEVAAQAGGTSYDIRGVGIASNDHVYVWFGNGTASSGFSTKLHHYRTPYAYKLPSFGSNSPADWRAWYRQITIQHLLNHRAGFTRSGFVPGAAELFNRSEAQLTYDHVHKHFLRTRKLLSEPGQAYSYSNHGFGLWTLLIEEISGQPYLSYVRNSYLTPLGLQDDIIPRRMQADSRTASTHGYSSGKPVPVNYESDPLGLAAGGFQASAQDLTRLMTKLEGKYSESDLDAMGWGKDAGGKLAHGGLTDGGTAYVLMLPDGYTSTVNGKDLSRVHVALVTNIRTDDINLEGLAGSIAREVPDANVPSHYDIWTDNIQLGVG